MRTSLSVLELSVLIRQKSWLDELIVRQFNLLVWLSALSTEPPHISISSCWKHRVVVGSVDPSPYQIDLSIFCRQQHINTTLPAR